MIADVLLGFIEVWLPEVRIFYIDEYAGAYYVKLYLELLDSGPYAFNLISKQKETIRRLVGPGDKVITLRIKNPDHLFCVLQQRPLENEQMGPWRFFKAVVGRPYKFSPPTAFKQFTSIPASYIV